ncbi:SusC/RagA family TonB-linked outer membrane protein [Empedobacter brevis]|uniref:SusC/RagA family TonB-linked outer membrane protein n=1 Tax=Empedobacter brevis TaxID=247 RepID=UPI0039AEE789
MRRRLTSLGLLAFLGLGTMAFAQVTGVVNDANNFPESDVEVTVKGTDKVTYTDENGNFNIDAKVGDTIIINGKEFKVTSTNLGTLNFNEVSKDVDLGEVVVVGYGVQKKSDVTGAISTIKGDVMEDLVTPSFEQQLAGRASGVQVTTNGGVIGEAPRIRIRGTSSINTSNSPLYVVDGVPVNMTNLSGGYTDINPLADINPNDIESFEVLKDGSATAIYGSRAANGVILITTKKGKKGAFDINLGIVTGVGTPMKYYDLLNGDQFTMISQEKTENAGVAKDYWAKYSGINTDWQREVLRKASFQSDYNLGISGGTENARYYLSLGYSQQEGTVIGNDLQRYSVRANVEQDVAKWLTIGSNLAFTKNDISAMNKSTTAVGGVMNNVLSQLPNVPVYDSNNPTGYNVALNNGVPQNYIGFSPWNTRGHAFQAFNIVYSLASNKYNSVANRIVSNSFINVKIVDGLSYRLQFGYDNSTNLETTFWSPKHGDGYSYKGIMSQYNIYSDQYNVQNILNYNKSFGGVHNLGATAVYEVQKTTFSYNLASGRDMTSDFFNQNIITGAFGTQSIGGSKSENGIMSYIGRVTYNYANRYFVQGSIRRDGISKLSPDTRWQNLYGASVGWNIAKENFWDNLKRAVGEFKIRGSYAQTGNTGFGNYAYQGLYSLQNYGNFNGIAYSQAGNSSLKWETSNKFDVGVDLAFINNRFRFTFDYYHNLTEDMILSKQLPASFGIPGNSININAGKMLNKGIELSLSGSIIDKDNFSWDFNANVSFQKNKVKDLPEPIVYTNNIVKNGESINALYGYKYYGVNKANGNPIYVKADGSLIQGNIDDNTYYGYDPSNPNTLGQRSSLESTDKFILGNVTPTYFGGITNTMKYKNFDLNFLIRFSGGNKIYNKTRQELLSYDFENNSSEILGRWQSVDNPGDGWTPKVVASRGSIANQTVANSRFVEKGDFIFLDNVQIGYAFPKDLLSKVNLKKARLFVSGQNLWMITDYKGIDPEMISTEGIDNYGVPRNRIFTLGLNVGF